jgi:hypothetical protein
MGATVATNDLLASEARQRPRAAAAAAGAAVLVLVSFILPGIIFADAPRATLLKTLEAAAAPGGVGEAPSARASGLEFYADHLPQLILTSVARGLGFLLIGLALTFLAFAARARSDAFPRFLTYLPFIGGALSAVSYILSPIGTGLAVDGFLDGPRTVDAAASVADDTLIVTAQVIGLPGTLALSFAFVLICLNAMKVGLLTRFLGVLGILSGVLFIIPIGSPLPVVQCFWLAALAALLFGRWPGGDPPAWRTGRAEPWPTQQQVREAREAGRAGAPAASKRKASEPVAAVAAPAADRPAHPSSRKKKRKRRD